MKITTLSFFRATEPTVMVLALGERESCCVGFQQVLAPQGLGKVLAVHGMAKVDWNPRLPLLLKVLTVTHTKPE